MKIVMMTGCKLFFAIVFFGIVAFAQTPKRIDFAKEGSNSLVWEEKVAANSSKSFVFYAKKGQNLKLGFIDDTNQGSMDLGKLSVEPNGDGLEMEIEVTKDYTFSVSNNSNKSTSFRIFISLENASAAPASANSGSSEIQTVALKFGKADFAEVNKLIPANTSVDFTFKGEKGLIAVVKATAPAGSLEASFCGKTLELNQDNTCKMETGGEWSILVNNRKAKPVSLTLSVGLEAGDEEMNANPSNNTVEGERIQFAKGETSASVTKDIPANGSVDFIFNVRKGQTIGYTVGYDFKDSDIEAFLTEPGMQDISKTSGPKEPQEFIVKKSGDHRLTINNTTKKKVTITLYLDIE